ncbi:MAG: hypothetical protein KTR13_03055 [Saprospiraceae bacterium]|nr:hypothetical protein [Saprospiraceae bacterium]
MKSYLTIFFLLAIIPLANASGNDSLFNASVAKWQHFQHGRNADSFLFYTKQVAQLADDSQDLNQLATAKRVNGYYQMAQGRFEQAEAFFNDALTQARENKFVDHEIKALWGLYKNLNAQQYYHSALKFAYDALALAEQKDDKILQVNLLIVIAENLRLQKEFEKGLEALENAASIDEKISPKLDINAAKIFNDRGNIFSESGEIDAAIFDYERAIEIYSRLNDSIQLTTTFSNLGQTYRLKGSQPFFDKAYDALYKSLEFSKTIGYEQRTIQNLISLAEVDIDLKQYNIALNRTLEAEQLNQKLNNKSLTYYIENNKHLIYQAQGKYNQSLAAFERATKIKEELNSTERAIVVTDLLAQYELEKNEKELLEKGIQLRKTKNLSVILGITSGILLLIFFGGLRFWRLYQRNTKLLQEQKSLKHQQKIVELESKAEMQAINAMLDGRDKERQAIAETLHDSVSTLLSSANMHLQAVKHKVNGEMPAIQKTQRIIKEASQKVRFLSHELISSILIKFGMEAAMNDLVDKISNDHLQFQAECSGLDQRFPIEFETKIYHIIEELCNNILKHSKATKAKISLHRTEEQLILEVWDNGIGFPVVTNTEYSGIGLNKIRARVKGMDGVMAVDSQTGEYARITIKLPVAEAIELA